MKIGVGGEDVTDILSIPITGVFAGTGPAMLAVLIAAVGLTAFLKLRAKRRRS